MGPFSRIGIHKYAIKIHFKYHNHIEPSRQMTMMQ